MCQKQSDNCYFTWFELFKHVGMLPIYFCVSFCLFTKLILPLEPPVHLLPSEGHCHPRWIASSIGNLTRCGRWQDIPVVSQLMPPQTFIASPSNYLQSHPLKHSQRVVLAPPCRIYWTQYNQQYRLYLWSGPWAVFEPGTLVAMNYLAHALTTLLDGFVRSLFDRSFLNQTIFKGCKNMPKNKNVQKHLDIFYSF